MSEAVYFTEFGGPEVLRVGPWPEQPLGERDVRIRVSAFALNRADLMYLAGEHYTIPAFPSRIGSEACGVVTETGSEVTAFVPGDRVTTIPFFTQNGVQGISAVVPDDYVTTAPDGLDDHEATAVWMQYLTPYFAFKEVCDLGEGDAVLITAASSSAGLGALQLCRELGVAAIATTRSPAKAEILRQSGASEVVVGDENLPKAISRASNGKGLQAAFDPLGGDSLQRYADHLAPGATVFGYGTLTERQPVVPAAAMCRARAVFHPYSMFNHVDDPGQRARGIALVSEAIRSGRLRPRVDRVFGFEHVVDAYRYMQSGNQAGKIVVTVP
ncbi:zinc-dependent alcohol dehydrogenase family protein [Amycolatopsis sp. La24]|uniref:zinc-dependent alcohol dehydrogenase family protein n=1 Tax=Amycolatopsis sp. La24 TaxID=3028304 RepID=UPI0023AF2023|nr:zinc-dependent alcohol dehydrogenase family protein [Amycolatopsis sp. La24]